MKKFLAVYYGSAASMAKWNALPESARKEREAQGIQAWMTWAKRNEGAIVETGAPLGKTKQIDARGVGDTKNELTAYTVVEAESHEAAAKLFLDHPHFSIFPGDKIEVMECLPIPELKS
jgi:hypothetical protein